MYPLDHFLIDRCTVTGLSNVDREQQSVVDLSVGDFGERIMSI